MGKKELKTTKLTVVFIGISVILILISVILGGALFFQINKVDKLSIDNSQLLQEASLFYKDIDYLNNAVEISFEYSDKYIAAKEKIIEIILGILEVDDELAKVDPNNPDFTQINDAYVRLGASVKNNEKSINDLIIFINKNNEVLKKSQKIDPEEVKNEFYLLKEEISQTHTSLKQKINLQRTTYGLPPI